MAKHSTIQGESAISEGNVEATHKQNPAEKQAGTASRMMKQLSNKSLRNLVRPHKEKKTNIADDSSPASTSTSKAKSRPRSHTLEMLEKQRRGEGQEFRPRKEMPNKDKKPNAAAAMLSPPTRSINKARHRPRSQTMETLAKQRREDEQQTFRPRNDSSLGGAMGRMSQ